MRAVAVVRVGGINSGHTVVSADKIEHIFRTLPTAAIDPSMLCVLPSGSYISLDVLFKEINASGISTDRLLIDPFTVVIDNKMARLEQDAGLWQRIGSTESGTGAAVIARLQRNKGAITFANEVPELQPYVQDTKSALRDLLNSGAHVVIEGTQGFGLSPLNSPFYPYCTSRDTTAGSFLGEAGLSPCDVENVIMVLRAYPIRVAGKSGPLVGETDWAHVTEAAGSDQDLTEYTSCTKRVRRVAAFDSDIVQRAIQVNQPNIIVMNHLDYIDYSCHDYDRISQKITDFVSKVSANIGKKIDYLGTGKAKIFKL